MYWMQMKGSTPHCFGSPYRPCMLIGFRSVDLPSSPLLIVCRTPNLPDYLEMFMCSHVEFVDLPLGFSEH